MLTVRADQSHLTQVFTCRTWNKVTTAALVSRDVKFNVTCKYGEMLMMMLHKFSMLSLECNGFRPHQQP